MIIRRVFVRPKRVVIFLTQPFRFFLEEAVFCTQTTMLSMLERIKGRQKLLDQQRNENEKSQCADNESPSQSGQPGGNEDGKNSSHHRKERKPKEKSRKPPKVIYLNFPTDPLSPLHISRSLCKRSRKSREHITPKKKQERKQTQASAEIGKEAEQKPGDESCCSSSVNHNDSILNESWDLASFVSGDVSFTQQVTTQFDGNRSTSSKGHPASSRRGSIASSRRGSMASSRRDSIASSRRESLCSKKDANDSSMSSSVLDELEVRSKGTIKCRPSYSEIKGNVSTDASKSLLRRYSIDNSNLLSGQAGSHADLPSCLQICEAKLNVPCKSKDQGLGACYGIIDKYMMGGNGKLSDAEKAVRRSQSYALEDRSSCDEESLSSSSLVTSDSSKRVSMAPSNLKQQLKNAYQKKTSRDFTPNQKYGEKDGCKLPERSKSDTSNLQSNGHTDEMSLCQSPKRTNSDGIQSSRGALPGLPPALASPRKAISNAEIFKKSPGRKISTKNQTRATRDKSRSKKSSRRSDDRSRRSRPSNRQPQSDAVGHKQATTCSYDAVSGSEEFMNYVPTSLRANQPYSRRKSTGQEKTGETVRNPGSPQRRKSTGKNQEIYPVKDDEVRSYLETELNVAKSTATEENADDYSSDNTHTEENSKKKGKKPRVSKAA